MPVKTICSHNFRPPRGIWHGLFLLATECRNGPPATAAILIQGPPSRIQISAFSVGSCSKEAASFLVVGCSCSGPVFRTGANFKNLNLGSFWFLLVPSRRGYVLRRSHSALVCFVHFVVHALSQPKLHHFCTVFAPGNQIQNLSFGSGLVRSALLGKRFLVKKK
jgi:hypothetical protein